MCKCDKCKYQDKHFKSNGIYYCSENLLYPNKIYEKNCQDFKKKTITQGDRIRSMSDAELKPCPFCGGKPKFIQNKDCKQQVIGHMRCVNCGISQNQHNFTESLAIHEWNRRTNEHE